VSDTPQPSIPPATPVTTSGPVKLPPLKLPPKPVPAASGGVPVPPGPIKPPLSPAAGGSPVPLAPPKPPVPLTPASKPLSPASLISSPASSAESVSVVPKATVSATPSAGPVGTGSVSSPPVLTAGKTAPALKPEPVAAPVPAKPMPQATIKLQPAPAPAVRKPAASDLAKPDSLNKPQAKDSKAEETHLTEGRQEVDTGHAVSDIPLPLLLAAVVLAFVALGIQIWTFIS
jgi:hypothetical protein